MNIDIKQSLYSVHHPLSTTFNVFLVLHCIFPKVYTECVEVSELILVPNMVYKAMK